ncbi:aldehyde dehydrogenase family protein, partial [Rubrobacter aplysinae]|uniref:aldehyde dehydrogenase family protein n=1 Tax=Rubrobacter aplysinae TaxID=909625 RepID=UPI00128C2629
MPRTEKGFEVKNLIDGKWESTNGANGGSEGNGGNGSSTEPVYDPATGEVIASTPLSSREELDRAVSAAGEAFRAWSATPVVDRARVLFR